MLIITDLLSDKGQYPLSWLPTDLDVLGHTVTPFQAMYYTVQFGTLPVMLREGVRKSSLERRERVAVYNNSTTTETTAVLLKE